MLSARIKIWKLKRRHSQEYNDTLWLQRRIIKKLERALRLAQSQKNAILVEKLAARKEHLLDQHYSERGSISRRHNEERQELLATLVDQIAR